MRDKFPVNKFFHGVRGVGAGGEGWEATVEKVRSRVRETARLRHSALVVFVARKTRSTGWQPMSDVHCRSGSTGTPCRRARTYEPHTHLVNEGGFVNEPRAALRGSYKDQAPYEARLRGFTRLVSLVNEARQPRKRGSSASYCLLYTSPSPRDRQKSRMPSSA